MTDVSNDAKQRLDEALAHNDGHTRSARVNRLVWLSRFEQLPGLVAWRLEPLALLEEARVCYINGHYIAVLLTATAFIEQVLVEALEDRAIRVPRGTLAHMVETARAAELLPAELLDQTDRLREIRNPFAHRKPDGHVHGLAARYRAEQIHPTSLLEEDALHAIELIYRYFSFVVKSARPG